MTRLSEFTADQLTRAKALDAVRLLKCSLEGGPFGAFAIFQERYPLSLHVDLIRKAAVDPGTTTDSQWASPLVSRQLFAEGLLRLALSQALEGRLNFRRAPFNISVPAQLSSGTYNWAGQGKPKPVGALAFESVTLAETKTSGIIVLAEELLRSTSTAAERALRDLLVAELAYFLDQQLFDPSVTEVANVRPASITNGATEIPSSLDPRDDITTLVSTFTAQSPDARDLVLLMSPATAAVLATNGSFPDIRIDGSGFVAGIRALTSSALGHLIVLLDPSQILLASEDTIDLVVSRHAAVQMNTTPDDPATASTVLTSLWQHNLVGIRVERPVNWKRARSAAVAYISGAIYQGTSP